MVSVEDVVYGAMSEERAKYTYENRFRHKGDIVAAGLVELVRIVSVHVGDVYEKGEFNVVATESADIVRR